MRGDVQLESSDGLDVDDRAADLQRRRRASSARAGPVAFSRRRLTGTSVGMTYDESRDVL